MEPIFENPTEGHNVEVLERQFQEADQGEPVKPPKLVKPVVESQPELLELYQTEMTFW